MIELIGEFVIVHLVVAEGIFAHVARWKWGGGAWSFGATCRSHETIQHALKIHHLKFEKSKLTTRELSFPAREVMIYSSCFAGSFLHPTFFERPRE
jgi:hypothetical protein